MSSSTNTATSVNSYPRLADADVHAFVDTVVQNEISDQAVARFISSKGIASDAIDSAQDSELRRIVEEFVRAAGEEVDQSVEPLEAKFCIRVFHILEGFAPEALGDREFWNFLGVQYFWKVVKIRQNAAWNAARGEPNDPSRPEHERQKLSRYLIGKDHYQIPLRMYLRAQAVREGDEAPLCEIEGGGTDFWRSHVLAVITASYPPLARSLVRAQQREKHSIDDQRPRARQINRLRVNAEYALHEDDDLADLVNEIWS